MGGVVDFGGSLPQARSWAPGKAGEAGASADLVDTQGLWETAF